MSSRLLLALLSCLLLGLRHGFDYDHLAAITDIASVEEHWRARMRLGLLYALGHAATVAALGCGVILLHVRLPASLDPLGERLVGFTLLLLSLYVIVALLRTRERHMHQPASRIAVVITALHHLQWHVRRLIRPGTPKPVPFRFHYQEHTAFVIGIIHGLGAETPSQLLLFLLAAQLGGPTLGILGLLCFIVGLLAMNTLMTAVSSRVFSQAHRRRGFLVGLNVITAVYSASVGLIFLLGRSEQLPSLVR